jgi:hypothetical protein
VVSTDAYAGPIAWAIATAARTGQPDDGTVSVETVEEACRIRTGERGTRAVSARLDPADASHIAVAPRAGAGAAGVSDSTKVLLTNVVLTTLFLVVFLRCAGRLRGPRRDPCGAISVHGYCGWLGAICVGIFAHGSYGAGWNGVGATSYLGVAGVTGLLYGDTRQFPCQVLGSTICMAWAFGMTFVVFKTVNAFKTMRVPKEVELEDLDMPEFGMPAYPEDAVVAEA